MYLDHATINIEKTIKDVLYGYGEFEHLQEFLIVYIHDNYQVLLGSVQNQYIVQHVMRPERLYMHHSFSNCVEWVFNNCELSKGL